MSIKQKVIDIIATWGPWLAPVPTAWAVGYSVYDLLGWPVIVAACAGLAVEIGNISAVYTALELRTYNQDKRQADPAAPTWIAFVASAVTLAASFVLAVFIEVFPGIAVWSAAVFPILSLSGAIVLALRADHVRRLSAIAESKEKERDERAKRKEERRQRSESLPESKPVATESTEGLPEDRKVGRRRAAWPDLSMEDRMELSGKTPAEILELYDLSEKSARNWYNRLKSNGKVAEL